MKLSLQALVILTLAILLGLAASSWAVEHSSSDTAAPATEDQRPVVLRPLYLFNMRGRHDPFVDGEKWSSAGSGSFSITALQFKGIIEVSGVVSALFVSSVDQAMYTLRGEHLFGSDDKAVSGVSGRFITTNDVRLKQGDMALNFSALRDSKRKI